MSSIQEVTPLSGTDIDGTRGDPSRPPPYRPRMIESRSTCPTLLVRAMGISLPALGFARTPSTIDIAGRPTSTGQPACVNHQGPRSIFAEIGKPQRGRRLVDLHWAVRSHERRGIPSSPGGWKSLLSVRGRSVAVFRVYSRRLAYIHAPEVKV